MAGAKLSFPAWVASMAQVPTALSVTELPETPHVLGVVGAKLTARPDDAVADTLIGEASSGFGDRGPNVMVCVPWVIWKLCVTGLAGE